MSNLVPYPDGKHDDAADIDDNDLHFAQEVMNVEVFSFVSGMRRWGGRQTNPLSPGERRSVSFYNRTIFTLLALPGGLYIQYGRTDSRSGSIAVTREDPMT